MSLVLNGLPAVVTTMPAAETAALEALALSPVNLTPNDNGWVQILIGTPTLGQIHIAWYNAMQSLVCPPNWATVRLTPTGYTTADAQNLIVNAVLRDKFRAVLFIEDDTCPPPQALIEFDRWLWKMERKDDQGRHLAPPVVSGLYHLKGSAEVRKGKTGGIQLLGPEPLIYRESGSRAYRDWTYGDVVWCSGVPTGALLIHRSVLDAWANEPDLETYTLNNYPHPIKRIFSNPSKVWVDPQTKMTIASSGTSDLYWSAETIRRRILTKAGWPEYAKKRYPFIVDTSLRFGHLDRITGTMF